MMVVAVLPLAGLLLYSGIPVLRTTGEQISAHSSEAVDSAFRTEEPSAAAESSSIAEVYLFLSLDCPISNYYLPQLNQLHERYSAVGIRFAGVVSGLVSTPEEVERHQQEYGIRFPLVWDRQNQLSQQWGATHTPQAI